MRIFLLRLRISRALLLGCICIALVMLSGMIHAAHFHSLAGPDHDCALCLAVHTVVQAAPALALHITCQAMGRATPVQAVAVPRSAVYFRLTGRAPPIISSQA
ncbi:MAG TPA: hypothetical protein VJS11_02130 [Acidobacteriaceae bacterium]|nr:hypothetical protein [Acidobacteriaceae bacterium]